MGDPQSDTNGMDGFAEGPDGDKPMSFFDHIGDLRKRLMRAVASLVLCSIGAFVYVDELTLFLKQPLLDAWSKSGQDGLPNLQALSMQAPVMVDFWVAFMAGIAFSIPVIFYQMWSFVAPGLYAREKKFVIPFVLVSSVMFIIGAGFAYRYVIPFIYQFFIEYAGEGELVQPELSAYYKGTCKVILAFGLVFELPLLAAFLAKFRIITEKTLLKGWKFAVIGIVVLAGFLTPPEPMSQMMMAVPMVLLYFISVAVAWVINPSSKVERELAEIERELEDEAAAEAAEEASANKGPPIRPPAPVAVDDPDELDELDELDDPDELDEPDEPDDGLD
jgi:sec-independent protein translocase protein TatC